MSQQVLTLLLISVLFDNTFSSSVLTHGDELKFGSFKNWDYCPTGSLGNAFEIKADTEGKTFNDEEGMTGIRLFCANEEGNETDLITSSYVNTGNWRGKNICPDNEYLNGFRIRIEKYRGFFKDDSAVNDLDMSCSGNTTIKGKGTSKGRWSEWIACPENEYICGIRTKSEESFTADKAGLVAVNMRCCVEGEDMTNFTSNSYDYDFNFNSSFTDWRNSNDSSDGLDETFNQIGTEIKNFANEGADTVGDFFNNTKKAFEDRFMGGDEDPNSEDGSRSRNFTDQQN